MFEQWKRRPWAVTLAVLALVALAAAGPAAAKDEKEAPAKAWLGVTLADVDADMAEAMDVPQGEGALINDVIADSPAEEAGLEDGDVVVRFDDRRVGDASALSRAVRDAKPGDRVRVLVLRDGREKELQVTLGEAKERERIVIREDGPLKLRLKGLEGLRNLGDGNVWVFGDKEGGPHPFTWVMRGEPRAWMGVELGQLSEQLGGYFGVDDGEGALVQEVVIGSPAEKAGLKAGDVIVRVGDEDVEEPADVIAALEDAEPGDTVEVAVVRDRASRTLRVELGESPSARAHAEILKEFEGRELPEGRVLRVPDDDERDVLIRRYGPQSREDLEQLRQELKELREQLRGMRKELKD